jgi:peroxiredoxin
MALAATDLAELTRRCHMKSLTRCSSAGSPSILLVGWLLLALTWVGCQSQQTEVPADDDAPRRTATTRATAERPTPTPPTDLTAAPRIATQSPPDPLVSLDVPSNEIAMPEVLLSSEHAATCRVGVGDVFPDLPLASLHGQPTSVESQLGERLTIVVFWSVNQPMSVEQIRHLQQEIAEPHRSAGVSVITVNVANSAEDAQSVLSNVNGDFVNLHDHDGNAFAEVATSVLPRTYLLRSDRQVVWFDMEYSRSTSRELDNAILYVLRQFEQQANDSSSSLR